MRTTSYCPAIFSVAAKACLLSAAVLALRPALVQAGGPQTPPNWNVSGEWQLSQKADKLVTMKLNQTDYQITGTASSGTMQGKVSGYTAGDAFVARVTWVATLVTKKETVSNYSGTIGQDGTIKGTMNPKDSDWQSESFVSLRAMKRFQPASTGKGTGSGSTTSAPTKTSTGATGPTGSTSTPTATPADESSSSDSEDSHKKHKKKHKHRHQNEQDEENQDNS